MSTCPAFSAACTPSRRSGFSLVELSIVLVIIGLIIGGVMAGSSLIRNSRLHSVLTDVENYRQATQQFSDKYQALPGDFLTATTVWGADAACPATPANSVPKQATCNGNGNGSIDTVETWRFWQQLANAAMISGYYSGVSPNGAWTTASIGINAPMSKADGAGYSIYYYGNYTSADARWFNDVYGHVFMFGSVGPDVFTTGPAITPEEAASIDAKADDGKPAYGIIMSWKAGNGSTPNCLTTAVAATATYNTAYSGRACNLIFKSGF